MGDKKTKLIESLKPILNEGEELLAVTTGTAKVKRMGTETSRNVTLFVSNTRVGMYSKKLGGHELLDFAFGLLTSIDHKTGVLFGNIHIMASGDSIDIRQVTKEDVEPVTQAMRSQMALSHNPHSGNQSKSNIIEELKQLAELHSSGVLSDEEFATAKANLLNK